MKIKESTHVGMIREINEDSILTLKSKDYCLLIIADGMGGHTGGEIASSTAVNSIKEFIEKGFETYKDKEELIRESILDANKKIYKSALNSPDLKGMGTTITMALIIGENVYIGHVGDSRAYILKGEVLAQITEDHSYINELLKKGAITEEEAKVHPMKNLITRAVGTDKYIVIDTYKDYILEEDTLIMCSDGLTRHVSDEEIQKVIKEKGLETNFLVELANARGGADNISVIVARKEDNNGEL